MTSATRPRVRHRCIADIFTKWNRGDLDSYLIEITSHILRHQDEDGKPLVDNILMLPGRRALENGPELKALDLGIPVTLIGEAVFARCLSALKDERVALANC